MRFFPLFTVAATAMMALPAYSASPEESTSATYSYTVEEDCAFTGLVLAVEFVESDFDGTGQVEESFQIGYECNTEFTTNETPAGPLTNRDNVEKSADFVSEVAVASSFSAPVGLAASGTTGRYPADDGDMNVIIRFDKPGKPLTAGNYDTSVEIEIIGEVVSTN